jgi:UDP-glucose 4-epimerase
VREVIRAFESASGRTIRCEVAARRPGDCAESVADASLAARALGWKANLTIQEMCRDAWRWQEKNPQGYAGAARS